MNAQGEDLLILGVGLLLVALLTLGMMVLWSRAVRGRWPSGRKIRIFSGVCIFIWIFGFASYFYFKSH
jgi:hypothetical protein